MTSGEERLRDDEMLQFKFSRFAFSFAGLAVVTISGAAYAGYRNDTEICHIASDGSGYCAGNFRAFANAPNNGDHVSVNVEYWPTYTSYSFDGSVGASAGTCVPNSKLQALWPQFMAHQGAFSIGWDATGTCTDLELYNASQSLTF